MSKKNYFKVNRRLLNHPLWKSEPFTKGQAWVDLIGSANYADSHFYKKTIRINIKRGQSASSIETLKVRWKWSRGKVSRFLNLLETEGMIVQQRGNQTTMITICNYEVYQSSSSDDSKADSKADSKTNDKADGRATIRQTEGQREASKNIKEESKKNKELKKDTLSVCERVIEYLNKKTGSKYRHTTQSYQKAINARLADGYKPEDLKKVIDIKTAEWLNTEYQKHLNPETLFRPSNFDRYLNQLTDAKTKNNLPTLTRDQVQSILKNSIDRANNFNEFKKIVASQNNDLRMAVKDYLGIMDNLDGLINLVYKDYCMRVEDGK